MDIAHAATTPAPWQAFLHRYRNEMRRPDAAPAIALLAALSQGTDFSAGCGCEDEAHCHRHELHKLLLAAGATVSD